jgi:hypothetical protein
MEVTSADREAHVHSRGASFTEAPNLSQRPTSAFTGAKSASAAPLVKRPVQGMVRRRYASRQLKSAGHRRRGPGSDGVQRAPGSLSSRADRSPNRESQ